MTHSEQQTQIVKELRTHCAQIQSMRLGDLFSQEPHRFEKYSINANDLFLDYSKNKFTSKTLNLLIKLLDASAFYDWRQRLFNGDEINLSEKQAALHTILRRPCQPVFKLNDKDLTADIFASKLQMKKLCATLSGGAQHSGNRQAISDIVSLGIGGSHKGPAMICRALAAYKKTSSRVHFVSTTGCGELESLLSTLDPKRTCFLVVSKKFKTQETLMNANLAKAWLGDYAHDAMYAVTSDVSAAVEFGIHSEHCLPMLDTIGGRYSLCSAAGLPFVVDLGFDVFEELLAGAHEMDKHFQTAAPHNNIPVILALLSIWYNNFYQAQSHAILCYDARLGLFPNYVQQVEMESNGKCVDRYGRKIEYDTAAVVWGGNALDGQHAYYQLLHQGTRLIPIDFIVTADTDKAANENAGKAWPSANCFAQSHILMQGVEDDATERVHPGNRPSNTIMLRKLTPRTLGALIALYEHKVFCEGLIWGINSFDQWGVEKSKHLAIRMFDYLQNAANDDENDIMASLDPATRGLIKKYLAWRK